jgi:hypothetical protein
MGEGPSGHLLFLPDPVIYRPWNVIGVFGVSHNDNFFHIFAIDNETFGAGRSAIPIKKMIESSYSLAASIAQISHEL